MRALILQLAGEGYMLPCLNKQLFGLECPGCGLQRAVALFFRGEFTAAFLMYPALYPLILLFGFLAADQIFKFKHSNSITIVLMVTSVLFILTNYILKFI